jgi:hypothetical protein
VEDLQNGEVRFTSFEGEEDVLLYEYGRQVS